MDFDAIRKRGERAREHRAGAREDLWPEADHQGTEALSVQERTRPVRAAVDVAVDVILAQISGLLGLEHAQRSGLVGSQPAADSLHSVAVDLQGPVSAAGVLTGAAQAIEAEHVARRDLRGCGRRKGLEPWLRSRWVRG